MNCPNYTNCQLIHKQGFVESEKMLLGYSTSFCTDEVENWRNCKRFITNNILHFCPDFVFPDSPQSVDEIIDRYELEYL